MLKWDPTDLLICLKVEPHRDRDGVEHSYVVEKDGLRLLISVFQFDGDVYFSLFRDTQDAKSLIDLKINQCPAIELVERNGDEWLDFLPGGGRTRHTIKRLRSIEAFASASIQTSDLSYSSDKYWPNKLLQATCEDARA